MARKSQVWSSQKLLQQLEPTLSPALMAQPALQVLSQLGRQILLHRESLIQAGLNIPLRKKKLLLQECCREETEIGNRRSPRKNLLQSQSQLPSQSPSQSLRPTPSHQQSTPGRCAQSPETSSLQFQELRLPRAPLTGKWEPPTRPRLASCTLSMERPQRLTSQAKRSNSRYLSLAAEL